MRLVRYEYKGQHMAVAVCSMLLGESTPFKVTPLPDDHWWITVRDEGQKWHRAMSEYARAIYVDLTKESF